MGFLLGRSSSEEILYDVAFLDACQAGIESSMAEGELLVIEAHEVQNGGVEIADVDRFLDGAQANLIRGTVDDAGLHTAAREP